MLSLRLLSCCSVKAVLRPTITIIIIIILGVEHDMFTDNNPQFYKAPQWDYIVRNYIIPTLG